MKRKFAIRAMSTMRITIYTAVTHLAWFALVAKISWTYRSLLDDEENIVTPPWQDPRQDLFPSTFSYSYVPRRIRRDVPEKVAEIGLRSPCEILLPDDEDIFLVDDMYDCSTTYDLDLPLDQVKARPPDTRSAAVEIPSVVVLVLEQMSRARFERALPKTYEDINRDGTVFKTFHAPRVPHENWPSELLIDELLSLFSAAGLHTFDGSAVVSERRCAHGHWSGRDQLETLRREMMDVANDDKSNDIFAIQRLGGVDTKGADDVLLSFVRGLRASSKPIMLWIVSPSGRTTEWSWRTAQASRQNALLPIMSVSCFQCSDGGYFVAETLRRNANRLVSAKDVTTAWRSLASQGDRRNMLVYDMLDSRTCDDASIEREFCLCVTWEHTKIKSVAMIEAVLGYMNNIVRSRRNDVVSTRGVCDTLRLSTVLSSVVARRSSFLRIQGPHLLAYRYRFRFRVRGRGVDSQSVQEYEADAVKYVWHMERTRDSDRTYVALEDDIVNIDQVVRAHEAGTIVDYAYVPVSWTLRRDGDNTSSDLDCSARFAPDHGTSRPFPCMCKTEKTSEATEKETDVSTQLTFLRHTDSPTPYVIVNKMGIRIIRWLHRGGEEFYEVINMKTFDITFEMIPKGPVSERTLNVLYSSPMPSSMYVPSRGRRFLFSMERVDSRRRWKRSFRWSWHRSSSAERAAHARATRGKMTRTVWPFEYARVDSYTTRQVSYTLRDGVAMWKVFDMKGSSSYAWNNRSTVHVYVHNARDNTVHVRVRYDTSFASETWHSVVLNVETTLFLGTSETGVVDVTLESDETMRVVRVSCIPKHAERDDDCVALRAVRVANSIVGPR